MTEQIDVWQVETMCPRLHIISQQMPAPIASLVEHVHQDCAAAVAIEVTYRVRTDGIDSKSPINSLFRLRVKLMKPQIL